MTNKKTRLIKKMKRNTILPILLLSFFSFIFISFISITLVSFFFRDIINNQLDYDNQNVKYCTKEINSYFESQVLKVEQCSAYLSGRIGESQDIDVALEDFQKYVDNSIILNCKIVDNNGNYLYGEEDEGVTQREFYTNALNGNISVYSDEWGGESRFVYSAPIYNSGEVVGVMYFPEGKALIDLVDDEEDIKNSGFYIVNDNNEVISKFGQYKEDFQVSNQYSEGYTYTERDTLNYDDVAKMVNSFNLLSARISDAESVNDTEYFKYEVWYNHDLKINDWSIIVCKIDTLDKKTVNEIAAFGGLVTLILIVPFVLMLVVVFAQIRGNGKLKKLLYLDVVTGGHNWIYFQTVVSKKIKKSKEQYAMVAFEINKFMVLNDVYGNNEVESILEQITKYINANLGRKEYACRYAINQYNMILEYSGNNQLVERINRILEGLSSIYPKEKLYFNTGIYVIPDKKISIDRMNNYASIAVQLSRKKTDSPIIIFDDKIRSKMLNEKEIEDCMESALDNEEFQVYLQPKYSTIDRKLSGAEALVRWKKDGRIISPGVFIPIFEINGFIVNLDDYMIKKVAMLQEKWIKENKEVVPISVNVSRVHLNQSNLAEHIRDIVDQYEVPHNLIEIELTESAFFDNKNIIIETVDKLKEYGFSVSMDDFGSGYSSLNSLKDLPLDVVKLDGEFFKETKDEERGRKVVKDTISMAKNLDMLIVAEGIETIEQVEFLEKSGCDLIQGFYFARPMPVEEFEKLQID